MQAIRQPLIKKKEERDWQKDTFAFERRSDEMAAGFTLSMNLESFWESLSFFGVSIPFCPSSNISKSFCFYYFDACRWRCDPRTRLWSGS